MGSLLNNNALLSQGTGRSDSVYHITSAQVEEMKTRHALHTPSPAPPLVVLLPFSYSLCFDKVSLEHRGAKQTQQRIATHQPSRVMRILGERTYHRYVNVRIRP